jgi:hypothetical protein
MGRTFFYFKIMLVDITPKETEALKQANAVMDAATVLLHNVIQKHKITGYDDFTCKDMKALAYAFKLFG